MYLQSLQLTNFRNYELAEVSFATEGLTVIIGENGQGKTNLLEAIAYVSNLRSFRTHDSTALIGKQQEQAVLRSVGYRNLRELSIDVEINTNSRSRTFINKQPLKRNRDLGDSLSATVFSPDDLQLVKGGPAERRRLIDELLADSSLSNAALIRDIERITRQRNTLLKQSGGRLTPEIALTLDVWDDQLATKGEQLGDLRNNLIEELQPIVVETYRLVANKADTPQALTMEMLTEWRASEGHGGLSAVLAESRKADVARGLTTKGPHRDDVEILINGMAARTHASQGEQRTLALVLRLAGHRFMTEKLGAPPLLLLDDVLSELDINRVRGLLESLPTGQTFLTTASPVSNDIKMAGEIRIMRGVVE